MRAVLNKVSRREQRTTAVGTRPGASWRVGALVLALSLSASVWTQPEDPGRFEVRTGTTELINGVYYVDALIYLRLPTEVENALRSKFPLTIRIEVQFLNRLRFWFDPVEREVVQRYQLSYFPVSDRYVVYNVNVEETRSFGTLADALQYVGEVDDLPVVDASLLDEDRRYDVRIRAELDKKELSGPLRVRAWFRRDWSISSDWLQWRLDDE